MNISRFTQKPKTLAAAALALALLAAIVAGVALMPKESEKRTYQPASAEASVNITANSFDPAVLSVKKGTRIIWTNSDQAMHQVVSNPHPSHDSLPGLKSEILNQGQTYEYVASQSGSFSYHDEINPTVNVTIEVEE